MGKTGVHQPLGNLRPLLPIGRAGHQPAGVTVQPQPDAFVEQAQQVVQVGIVVAVADVNPVQVNPFIFQDGYLLLPDALRRPGMGGNGDAGGLVRPGRRPQHHFLRGG